MAFTYAGHWIEALIDYKGDAQTDVPITVFLPGTTTPATLYTNRTKGTSAANPTATDTRGNLSIFADPGEYDLFTGTITIRITVPIDPQEVHATPDATTSTKGSVQLAGDLGGTAASPTVPGLAGKANSSALTLAITNEVARADAAYAARVPEWLPNHAYLDKELATNSGSLYQRVGAGTSGSSFDSANWTLVGGAGSSSTGTVPVLRPESYGADGTVAGDTAALIAMSQAAQALAADTVAIAFECRTYTVGQQVFANNSTGTTAYGTGSYMPVGIISTGGNPNESCLIFIRDKNVLIYGNGARLKMASGMKVGMFDPVTGTSLPTNTATYPSSLPAIRKYYAQTPDVIRLAKCPKVSIFDLEIDGGVSRATLGGPVGLQTTEYSLPGAGIYFDTCGAKLLSNVNIHHCVIENLTVSSNRSTYNTSAESLTCLNTHVASAGRNNVWLSSANNVTWKGGSINWAGDGAVRTSPAAGIDFETYEPNTIRDVTFDSVEFIGNGGFAHAISPTSSGRNYVFRRCRIQGTFSQFVLCSRRPDIVYEDCEIFGSLGYGQYGDSQYPESATKFIRCRIEDRDIVTPIAWLDRGSPALETMRIEVAIDKNPTLAGKVEFEVVAGSSNRWRANVYLDGTLVYASGDLNQLVSAADTVNNAQNYVRVSNSDTTNTSTTAQPALGRQVVPIISTRRGNPLGLLDAAGKVTLYLWPGYGRSTARLQVQVSAGTSSGVKVQTYYDVNNTGSFTLMETFDNLTTVPQIAAVNSYYIIFRDGGSPNVNPLPATVGPVGFGSTLEGVIRIINDNMRFTDCTLVGNKAIPFNILAPSNNKLDHVFFDRGSVTHRYNPGGTHPNYSSLRSISFDGTKIIEELPSGSPTGQLSLVNESLPLYDQGQGGTRTINDVVTHAGSVLATGSFVSGDATKAIVIKTALDGSADLATTISSVDTTQTPAIATLAVQAGADLTNASATIGGTSKKTLTVNVKSGYSPRNIKVQVVAGVGAGTYAFKVWHRDVLAETSPDLTTPADAAAWSSNYLTITNNSSTNPAPYNQPPLGLGVFQMPGCDIGARGLYVPGPLISWATWDTTNTTYKSGWIAQTNPATARHLAFEPDNGTTQGGTDIGHGPIIVAFGTAAPTTGYWRVGSVIINQARTVSSDPFAWTCVTAGYPGTWVTTAGPAGPTGTTGRPGIGFGTGFRSGLYYTGMGNTVASAMTANLLTCVPIFVNVDTTFDQLALEVTNVTSVDAGTTIRMGIFADSADSATPGPALFPGDLIYDAGTVLADSTSGTGLKTITLGTPQTLLAGTGGRVYWLGSVLQSSGTNKPTCRMFSTFFSQGIGTSSGSTSGANGYQQSVSGALPSTFTSTVTPAINAAITRIRAA